MNVMAVHQDSQVLDQKECPMEIESDNVRWDTLLATEEAQDLLVNMADEALAEHRAGKTRCMIFDKEGRIRSGRTSSVSFQ